MCFDFNNAHLMGRLTKDPEFFDDGTEKERVCFSLAINKKKKDRKDVLFLNFVAFGKCATLFKTLEIKKGDPLFVSGHIQTSEFINKEGKKQQTFSIVVSDFNLLRDKDKAA